MQQLDNGLKSARERVKIVAEIMRWVWVINAAVMIVGAMEKRWTLTAVAGVSWIMTLVAAAVAKRVDIYLNNVEQIVRQNCSDESGNSAHAMKPLVRYENR